MYIHSSRARLTWVLVSASFFGVFASPAIGVEAPSPQALNRADRWDDSLEFFPGTRYFQRGCEYFARGNVESALEMWRIASGWAKKEAQYNLGLVYFKGDGVETDRSQGLAWLGLAAERHEAPFQESLELAWANASAEEREQAEEIFLSLVDTHGDKIARARALRNYEFVRRNFTGTRVGSAASQVKIVHRDGRTSDAAWVLNEAKREADAYFSVVPRASTSVGPLTPILDRPATEESTSDSRPGRK